MALFSSPADAAVPGTIPVSGTQVSGTQKAPTINEQATSATVDEGSTVKLYVKATGSALTYEWKKDQGTVLGTQAELTLSKVQAANQGTYVCTVKNGTKPDAVSKPITITVRAATKPSSGSVSGAGAASTTVSGGSVSGAGAASITVTEPAPYAQGLPDYGIFSSSGLDRWSVVQSQKTPPNSSYSDPGAITVVNKEWGAGTAVTVIGQPGNIVDFDPPVVIDGSFNSYIDGVKIKFLGTSVHGKPLASGGDGSVSGRNTIIIDPDLDKPVITESPSDGLRPGAGVFSWKSVANADGYCLRLVIKSLRTDRPADFYATHTTLLRASPLVPASAHVTWALSATKEGREGVWRTGAFLTEGSPSDRVLVGYEPWGDVNMPKAWQHDWSRCSFPQGGYWTELPRGNNRPRFVEPFTAKAPWGGSRVPYGRGESDYSYRPGFVRLTHNQFFNNNPYGAARDAVELVPMDTLDPETKRIYQEYLEKTIDQNIHSRFMPITMSLSDVRQLPKPGSFITDNLTSDVLISHLRGTLPWKVTQAQLALMEQRYKEYVLYAIMADLGAARNKPDTDIMYFAFNKSQANSNFKHPQISDESVKQYLRNLKVPENRLLEQPRFIPGGFDFGQTADRPDDFTGGKIAIYANRIPTSAEVQALDAKISALTEKTFWQSIAVIGGTSTISKHMAAGGSMWASGGPADGLYATTTNGFLILAIIKIAITHASISNDIDRVNREFLRIFDVRMLYTEPKINNGVFIKVLDPVP